MDNIYILREIARWDKSVWRLFSLLNKESNEYFCIGNREYEITFRTIKERMFGIYYKLDGKRHRSDGPAIIENNGDEEWYLNDKRHRLDGPAQIQKGYCNFWYKNGKFHRLDGPAIEYVNEEDKKYNKWFVDGMRIKKK